MSSSSSPQGCPSSDELSASLGGAMPEEIAVHVESCPACQRQLDAFRLMDRVIRRRMLPPEGFAERVRQRVSEDARRESVGVSGWWLSPVLRLAAAVVITAAALAVLVHALNDRAQPDQVATEAAPALLPPSPVPADPGLAPLDETSVRYARAGTGASPESGAGSGALPALPRNVRHVWTVADAEGEGGRLRELLPKGSYEISHQDGNTVFTVVLADRDLQALVDQLSDRKWQLVTPDLPQPRKRSSVALSGHEVHYSLVLVAR